MGHLLGFNDFIIEQKIKRVFSSLNEYDSDVQKVINQKLDEYKVNDVSELNLDEKQKFYADIENLLESKTKKVDEEDEEEKTEAEVEDEEEIEEKKKVDEKECDEDEEVEESHDIDYEMYNFKNSIDEGSKEEYEKFFKDKLKKYNVNSVAELSAEDKKKFFNEIKKEYKK